MNRTIGISIVGAAVLAALYNGAQNGMSLKRTSPAAHFTAAALRFSGEAPRHAQPRAAVVWGSSMPEALYKARMTGKPVVVDLFATWCGPCKMLDQAYSRAPLSTELTNWVTVKIDTDKDPTTARKYKVEAMPTLVFLRPDGSELGRTTGFEMSSDIHSKDQQLASIAQQISAALQTNRAKLGVWPSSRRRHSN